MRFPRRRAWLVLACFAISVVGAEGAVGALDAGLRSRGGLCVLIGGTADVAPAEDLLASGPWTIHWLDADAAAVERARRTLLERGLYGRVAVEQWDSPRLPYADNLVNVVVALGGEPEVNREELLRVLAPQGAAFFSEGGRVVLLDKPRPEEMGEWTHPWHGPDGGLVSSDRAFDAPNDFQWISGPPSPLGGRKSSAGAVLSAGGRVFQITQNVEENLPSGGPNYLVARDAFNGRLLWSRPWRGPTNRYQDGYYEAVVATAERVFGGVGEDVVVFDAATGEEIGAWNAGGPVGKLVLSDGIMLAQTSDGLTAFRASDGRRTWRFEAEDPWGTVAWGGRAFCLSSTREEDGRWRHDLLAVDMSDGQEVWRQPVESQYGARGTAVLRLHFARDGIVCLIERTALRVLSAEDGGELWHREVGAEARGRGGYDSRFVGHFYVQGNLWVRSERALRGRTVPETWLALAPRTGEVRTEVAATGPQGVVLNVNKQGCQPVTATERFVLDARLSTAWNLETGERKGWKFARGGCLTGVIPANGMAYAPPNACGCVGEQLRANFAVVRTDDPGLNSVVPAALQRGPAYGHALPEGAANATDWPTYRRDGRRSASLPGRLPADLRVRWRTTASAGAGDGEWRLNFGRPLTPPVYAEGLVLVADPQVHQVVALHGETGAEQWRFTAGGRVSLPPTVHRGLALFGAHDGYVYALRASDGELAWRFRAAPSDRRIMAYGQVESAWPVMGGVLVHRGLAIAAAGRTPDGGGGTVVHAIEPQTGEARWTRRVEGPLHGMPDLLVADGEHLFLMDVRLDAQTGDASQIQEFRYHISRAARFPNGVPFLRSGKAGFLDSSWTTLDMTLRMGLSQWAWGGSEGEILAFDGQEGFSFLMEGGDRKWYAPRTRGGGVIEARAAGAEEAAWSLELEAPEQVVAMMVTDDALLVAGPADRAAPEGPGFLRALSRAGGEPLAEVALPVAPAFDGLAAAGGRLFVTLNDGSVACLEAE